VDNKPALATIPAGDSSESTGPTARRIGSLPSDLSPWSMFLNADMVVKIVMIGLAFASVVTWTIWLARGLELVWANGGRVLQLTSCGTPKALRMEHERSSPDGREAALSQSSSMRR
jgi:hypothetical protein